MELLIVSEHLSGFSKPVGITSLQDLHCSSGVSPDSRVFLLIRDIFTSTSSPNHKVSIINKDNLLDYLVADRPSIFKVFLTCLDNPSNYFICKVLDTVVSLPSQGQCWVEVPII